METDMVITFAVQPCLCCDYVDSTRGVVRYVNHLTDKEQPQAAYNQRMVDLTTVVLAVQLSKRTRATAFTSSHPLTC